MARRIAPGKLDAYRARRDFSKTDEPAGADVAPGRRLVVQRHFARREHFDLRLEIDGVLASWAVTRGPSANPRDKRLAVRTEDHPLDYATFEGVIPRGQYGGGVVSLWEATTYEPLNGDPAAALAKGEIKFRSHGERLRGEWALVRMKTQDKRENWLLIKERDAFAEADDSLASRYRSSLVSGRDRAAIEAGAEPVRKSKLPRRSTRPAPAFVPPMLCESVEAPPAGAGWLAEMKYDGYRLQIAVGGGGERAYTRAGLDWSARFRSVLVAAAALPCEAALIDGEAVVFDANGLSDFPALVASLERPSLGGLVFVAFDLLSLDGIDLRGEPLRLRKKKLRALISDVAETLRFAGHVEGQAAQAFATAERAGAEGIIAKRADAPYVSGRSSHWKKIKAARREDVIVVGYMPSTKGESFASLLAAVEEGEELRYVGRVGTGYGADARARLAPRLTPGAKPAALGGVAAPPGAVWLNTPFRAEIGFGGWTGDRQLRQARFLAGREDLPLAKPASRLRAATPGGGGAIMVTHRERVLFPKVGVTKGDLADYYAAVAPRLAPHLRDRPVSILRAPDGVEGETFFQRHPLKGMTRGVIEVALGGKIYMALDGEMGLATAAQFGAVELHGWMSLKDAPDRPDRMAFDLDPHESVDFDAVKSAATLIRDGLASIGVKSWPLLSGGKGVHVVAPLDRSLTTQDVEAFAKGFAEGLASDAPDRFVASMSKARREGRIFIDWMRNKRGSTAILPWSARARPGASVAVPVTWASMARAKRADAFSLKEALAAREGWAGFFETGQTIPSKALEFVRARASSVPARAVIDRS